MLFRSCLLRFAPRGLCSPSDAWFRLSHSLGTANCNGKAGAVAPTPTVRRAMCCAVPYSTVLLYFRTTVHMYGERVRAGLNVGLCTTAASHHPQSQIEERVDTRPCTNSSTVSARCCCVPSLVNHRPALARHHHWPQHRCNCIRPLVPPHERLTVIAPPGSWA